jgi:DNA-binding MarR family transcriptional regulator
VDDLAAQVYLAVVRVARAVRREAPSGTLSASGLSALFALARCGPMRPTALAEVEALAPASATRILQSLEGEGLVRRTPDPSDGRAHLVELSEEGRAVVRQGTETRVDAVRRRLARLPAEDRATLEAALGALGRLAEQG